MIAALLARRPGPLAAGATAESRVILAALQRFFLALLDGIEDDVMPHTPGTP